jgi:hypothetical protein
MAGAATILLLGGLLFILWRLDSSVTRKTAAKRRYAQ